MVCFCMVCFCQHTETGHLFSIDRPPLTLSAQWSQAAAGGAWVELRPGLESDRGL